MKLNPEVYNRAKVAAEALEKELRPLIIGKQREAQSCCCGAISHGAATAVKIQPAGLDPEYEDQIGLWYIWTVKMRENDRPDLAPDDYSYSVGISAFVEVSVLREMFKRHFDGIDVEVSRG